MSKIFAAQALQRWSMTNDDAKMYLLSVKEMAKAMQAVFAERLGPLGFKHKGETFIRPVELAASLTGFRHNQTLPAEMGEELYEVLE